MVTVSELVVSIRGDGVEATQAELEAMEGSVEDSTEAMDDQASQLEELSQQFQGAMQVAAVGLAVAAGGLLSTVPVIGQLMDSLFGVVQSVGLAMDSVLRPVLGPLSEAFYELSGAIGEMSGGPLGTLIGILGTVAAVIAGALLGPVGVLGALLAGLGAGALLALVNFQQFKKGLQQVAAFIRENAPAAFERLKQVATNLLDSLASSIRKNLPTVVAEFVSLAGDIFNTIKTTLQETDWNQVGKDVMNFIVDAIGRFVSFVSSVVSDIIDKLETEFEDYDWNDLGEDIMEFIQAGLSASLNILSGAGSILAEELIEIITETDWIQLGKDIVNLIVQGIKAVSGIAGGAMGEVMDDVDKYLPSSPAERGPLSDLDKAGPALIDEFAGGIQSRTNQVTSATESAMSGSQSGGDSRLPRPRNTTTKLFIDGREAGRGTQKERFDESARRGQTF